jgi:SpoVK/Ycf46/Vps4 family AAA+-type ATPase
MGKLKVYYGWSKIGNVRKKRALSVMFENEIQGCRSDRGQRCLRTIQDTVFERYQTKAEEMEGRKQNRIFTEYSLLLDEKPINGSLERCLYVNSEADINHVSMAMRDRISEDLRKAFILANPDYKEPCRQFELKFE